MSATGDKAFGDTHTLDMPGLEETLFGDNDGIEVFQCPR